MLGDRQTGSSEEKHHPLLTDGKGVSTDLKWDLVLYACSGARLAVIGDGVLE